MKIHLQEIERSIPEAMFVIAEELLLMNQVQHMIQVEKNVWAAHVNDSGLLEVEAELNGNYLKAATCECSKFTKKNLCAHSIALLLAVRQAKNERKPKPKVITEDVKPPREKFTTNLLIENIDEKDLRKFVKTFAKQNRAFSIALKAKFAFQVDSVQGPEKYASILEEARKGGRRIGKAFNIDGQRNYLRVVKELIEQARQSVEMINFSECGAVILALLQELPQNIAFVVKSKHPILQPLAATYDIARELTSYTLAPELNESLQKFFLSALANPGPSVKYTQTPLLDILMSWPKDNPFEQELLDVINQLLESTAEETPAFFQLELARINVITKMGDDPFPNGEIEAHHPELIIRLLENLYAKKSFDQMEKVVAQGLKLHLGFEDKKVIQDHWLNFAKAKRDKKLIAKIAELQLLQTFDAKYIDDIALSVKNWNKQLPILFGKLELLPYSITKRNLIATLFRNEERPEALTEYICQTASLDLLERYAEWCHQYRPDDIAMLYPTLLKAYATQHIGPKASEKIQRNLIQIKNILGHKIAKELKTFFLKQYEHTSLPKSLYI